MRAIPLTLLIILVCSFQASARTWYIKVDRSGDAPTIKAGIDSAAVGDTVLVAPGRYTWSNQGTGSDHGLIFVERNQNEFVLKGEGGSAATTIDAQRQGRAFFIAGWNYITIEGFTITGGKAPLFGDERGGGIGAHLSHDIYRDLVFENNEAGSTGGGLWIGGHSTTQLENCVFRNNTAGTTGGGAWLGGSPLGQTLRNCVFEDNHAAVAGGGMYALAIAVDIEDCLFVGNSADVRGGAIAFQVQWATTMRRCTIVRNTAPDGAAMHLIAGESQVFENLIIASNPGGPTLGIQSGAVPSVSCSCLFGNAGGNVLPAGWIDGGGNFSLAPLFCNAGNRDYGLNGSSPCAPGNHPDGASCGQIGRHGIECGSVPTESQTWGRIKAGYGK